MSNTVKPRVNKPARHIEKISNCGALNVAQKQAVIGALRAHPKTYVQTADETSASTTVASSTYLIAPLEGGRMYRFTALLKFTQGTAANGLKVGINITGTQTSAVCEGLISSWDITNSALTSDELSLSSGAYTLSDDDGASYVVTIEGFIVPQNDGNFSVTYGEKDTGGGTAVLKKYSTLAIREVEAA